MNKKSLFRRELSRIKQKAGPNTLDDYVLKEKNPETLLKCIAAAFRAMLNLQRRLSFNNNI